ncbi:MAG: Gldg family protein [Clostridia bacterium]|nr:Gldg family protein [Clostridia bacterium]
MKNKKILKIGAYSVALSAIVLAVVIAVNLFVGQLPSSVLRPDLTPEKLTTVSDESMEILNGIKDDVTVYYIVTGGGEDPQIEGLLNRYADASDKITVTKVDPVSKPNFASEYTSQTLSNNSLIFVTDKRSTVVDGSELYKYEIVGQEGTYYTESEYNSIAQQYYYSTGSAPEATQYFFGENEITGAVDYVTGDKIPVMYALTGHGETDISSGAFGGLVRDENIEIKSLSLAAGETSAVPQDADAVLINAPTNDINDAEADALISYIDNGGDVILLTMFEKATADAVPNLAKVCDHMGLEAYGDIIADADSNHYYTYPFYILPDITGNGFSSLMSNTGVYLFMPVSHAIEITGTNADVETYSIARTSDSAYIYTEENANNPDSAEKNMYSTAYQSVQPEGGSLIWFGTPNIIDDSFVNYGNAELFLAALRSVCEKTTSVSIIGKPITSSYLEVTEGSMNMWTAVFAIVVVAVTVSGIAVFAVRRRK